jgi:hypothetical protein
MVPSEWTYMKKESSNELSVLMDLWILTFCHLHQCCIT